MNRPVDDGGDVRHPDMGAMTADQYAAWLEEHDGDEAWEPVTAEVSPNLTSVVSVRFNKGELGAVAAAAEAAGVKLSTYIRQIVLDTIGTAVPTDEEFVRHLRALTESLSRSQEAAQRLAQDMRLPRHRADGPISA